MRMSAKKRTMKPVDRFWSYVDKSGGRNSCWIWRGAKSSGRGQIYWENRVQLAHRVAYSLTFGEIPEGKTVGRRCAKTDCVNPTHLFLETTQDISRRCSVNCKKGLSQRWGDPIKRFWSYVDKSGGPDACWIWTGPVFQQGYGSFYWQRTSQKAHRVVYELEVGRIPKGMLVCHHCDNRLCVRPDHLFLGTHKDNAQDASSKGRLATGDAVAHKGEAHHAAKLTKEDVREIRNWAAKGISQREIAKKKGITQTNVSTIIARKTWKHIS